MSSRKPVAPPVLDLFCGGGGAARGYQNAGFYVIGVDNKSQPRYAGDEFIQADALAFMDGLLACRTCSGGETDLRLSDFAAIHASPPCQKYTTMNNRHGSSAEALIPSIRERLVESGVPWVIENVMGAKAHMVTPLRLTGEMFGLRVYRPRLFETSEFMLAPPIHVRQRDAVAVYGKNDGRRLWTRADGSELRVGNLEDGGRAMEIDWMTWDELTQAIPPAYTEYIGKQLMASLNRGAL